MECAFVFDWHFRREKSYTVIEAYCIRGTERIRWDVIGYKPYCFIEVVDEDNAKKLIEHRIHHSSESWYGPSTQDIRSHKRYAKVWFDGMPSMQMFLKKASALRVPVHMAELDPLSLFLSTYSLERTGWVQGIRTENGFFAHSLSMSESHLALPAARVLSLDIECSSSKQGMPRGYDPRDRIEMISIVTNDPSLEDVLLYIQGDCRSVETEDFSSIPCDDEHDLIARTFQVIRELDPDVITGYNVFGFDFRYILTRLRLGLDPVPDISRYPEETVFQKVEWESSAYGKNDYYRLECRGRVSFDAFLFFRRFRLERHGLGYVSEKYLGEGKDPISVEDMFRAFKTGDQFGKVATYCVQDARLVLKLMTRFSIWEELCETARAMDCAIGDIHTRGEQMKIVSQMTRECIHRQVVPVRRLGSQSNSQSHYQGAHVLDPIKGLHSPCTILDFQSLYPSIMIAFNICPSTYLGTFPSEDSEEESNLTGVRVQGQTCWIRVGPLCHGYTQSQRGVLPGLAEKLISKRKEVKELIRSLKDPDLLVTLDKRQNALKIAANSIYGAMGAKDSRYFSHTQSAESVTSVGRHLIQALSTLIVETYRVPVLYEDTDSCMIQAPPELGHRISAEITSLLPKPISLNFESSYDRILLLAKKMYVLYKADKGLIKYKGVIHTRRGYCSYAKEFYEDVLRVILETHDKERVKNKIKLKILDLMEDRIPLKELVVTKSIKNPDTYKVIQPHVDMALRLRSKGIPIEPGMRLEYVFARPKDIKARNRPVSYLPDGKQPTEMAKRTLSILEWDPEVYALDKEFYIEKQVAHGINVITHLLNWGDLVK